MNAIATEVPGLNEMQANGRLLVELASFTHDPLGYAMFAFPWGKKGELERSQGPREWQRRVLIELGDAIKGGKHWSEAFQKAIASGHGIGKSALVAMLIKWAMDTHDDTRGVVTANTDTQLRTKTWPELAKWHRLSITRHLFDLTATALISKMRPKEWRVDAVPWSENNTDAFAGLHNEGKRLLLIFDEASGISRKVWEVAEGALTDEHTEIIWCAFGNPTMRDTPFFDCFHKQRHRWHPEAIDSRTVEGTNKRQFEKWATDFGENSDFFRVRVRGEFPLTNAQQFISTIYVDNAIERQAPEDVYKFAPRVLGVDVARHGDDASVIIKRQGVWVGEPVQYRIPDTMQIAAEVVEVIENWKPDAVFVDATGIGWGVVDRLRQVGYGELIYAVQTGEKAGNELRYVNHRAELYGRMLDWLRESGTLPDHRDLKTDLTTPQYSLDGRNRFVLESKEDIKERGMPSPDFADALALTFHASIAPRTKVDEPEWMKRLTGIRRGNRPRHPMAA